MASSISDENKALAIMVSRVFGGKPHVDRHFSEDKKLVVDLLRCVNAPVEGATSFCTIGISDVALRQDEKEVSGVRLELLGVAATGKTDFAAVMSDAACYIMRARWWCRPGAILKHALDMYPGLSPHLKHLLFLPPVFWEDLAVPALLGDKKVSWLLAVPISDSERDYAANNGNRALEDIFERSQFDIFELDRDPVV